MKKWVRGKGMVDTVFEPGETITDEDVLRSRGKRRIALKEAQRLQRQGFERLSDVQGNISGTIRSHALNQWPKSLLVEARTAYEPRGFYGKPELRSEKWIKSPIEGFDPAAVMKVAELNYESRPQYRASWEVKLALEMSPEELETELLMHELGA